MKRSRSRWSLLAVLAMVFAMVPLTAASAAPSVVAFDMIGSASSNLISHTNPYAGAFSSSGDGFEKYQRAVSPSIPFSLMDDSLVTYPGDTLGVIDDNNMDEFFGVVDTENGDNSGPVSATWSFDISGATGLLLSIDMGAMGDFEAADSHVWTYSIDGAPAVPVFTSSVDEAGTQTYTLAGGAVFDLNDPMYVNGVLLSNVLQTLSTPVAGAGSTLDLTLTSTTDGGSEAYAVQNIVIEGDAGAPPPPPATGVFVSELHYDNVSTDVGEFVEVTGDAGSDLTGWTVELYNGSSSQLKVYATISLSGVIPDEDASQGAVAFYQAGIQNGSPDGLALVDAGGVVVEFWSYEGTFTPVSGSAAGMTSIDMGVSESGGEPIGLSLQVLSDVWTGPADESPGLLNTEPPPPPSATEEKIHDVQGPGLSSPLEGQQVIVEGVVTADHQDGEFNGWFMQEEDADHDADPATSEGIRILEGGNTVEVNVGDVVKLEGTVVEFFGETQITDIVDVVVTGTASFTATVMTLPFVDFDQREWYEGMYITVPQPLTISEYFNFDRFGEIVLTTGRHANPTAVFDPGSPEQAALALENALGRITLDDNRTSQNPDPAIHPNGAEFDLDNLFRGGDIVENATGVISYGFGQYRIQPTQGADYTSTNARQTSPDAVGGSLSVATFNVLNYFTTIDTGASICGPAVNQGCRGADSPEEFERQRTKIIAAIAEINADVVGLMEIENFVDGGIDEPITDLVSGINDVLGAGTYAAVETGAIGDDAIKVAFIYKPATVSLNGAYAVLDSSVDPTFNDDKNRPVLAQTFTQITNGESVTVAVNHFKSKGSNCNSLGDPDLGDGAGNCNLTRTSAAAALVNWLAADATGTAEDDVLIIGDLNSYDKEDPIDAILAGGYTDLVGDFGGELAYSYVFSGQWGYLDYAMANALLQSEVTGTTVWHTNADEPDILDYQLDFKQPPQQALYEPNAFRASDHDAVIVGLELDHTPPVVEADLIPDHGRFFTVSFSCVDDIDPNPTCVGDINGVPVEDGQTVALIWSKGKAKSWHEGPTLFIKDSSFTLTVVGTDAHGNSATGIKVL